MEAIDWCPETTSRYEFQHHSTSQQLDFSPGWIAGFGYLPNFSCLLTVFHYKEVVFGTVVKPPFLKKKKSKLPCHCLNAISNLLEFLCRLSEMYLCCRLNDYHISWEDLN